MKGKVVLLIALAIVLLSFLAAFFANLGYAVYANKNDDYWIFYVGRKGYKYYFISPSQNISLDFYESIMPVNELSWTKRSVPKYDPYGNRTISLEEALNRVVMLEVFPEHYMTWEEVCAEINPLGSTKVYRESAMNSVIQIGMAGAVLYLGRWRNFKNDAVKKNRTLLLSAISLLSACAASAYMMSNVQWWIRIGCVDVQPYVICFLIAGIGGAICLAKLLWNKRKQGESFEA